MNARSLEDRSPESTHEALPDSPHETLPVPLWRIRLLGELHAEQEDRVVARFSTRRVALLLAFLALHPDRLHPRELLADRLWPDDDLEGGRRNLRQCLSRLRALLEPAGARRGSVIAADRFGVGLTPGAFITDVAEFEDALRSSRIAGDPEEQSRWLERAIEVYKGDLLPGYYDDWLLTEQRRLNESYLSTLHGLARSLEERGKIERALPYARRAVEADPDNEAAHRTLMCLLTEAGEGSAALRYYEGWERRRAETGGAPSEATRVLAGEIRERDRADVSPISLRPSPAAPAASSGNLPHPVTSFVGREREREEIARLLSRSRLVTLTGSGGVGKTRCALRVAADRREDYPDGTRIADLAPLADPTLVAEAVASAVGVREESGRPLLATLAFALRDRKLLLLLDNCEHLLDACAALADAILRDCPDVTLLATSREPLGAGGEAIYRLSSLDAPDPLDSVTPEALIRFDASRLFLDRAAAANASFSATEANAAAMARICRRLEGIPLALELAAAWVRALPVEEIARRLDDRFDLLTRGRRMAPPRHRTLQAAMDWSYGLLTAEEGRLLRRLSVFAGGWTLPAAKAICFGGEGGEGESAEGEGLERLAALVDQSLVEFTGEGPEARYRLLETVRQYAREKLTEAGEVEEMKRRHLDFYLALAEEADRHLYGAEQAIILRRLERDHANLQAAFRWSLNEESGEAALRMVAALGMFWLMGSHLREGADAVTRALARDRDAPPRPLARAMIQGSLCVFHTDIESARHLAEEGLRLAREVGDRRTIAQALFQKGLHAVNGGELSEAVRHANEGTALALAEGDRFLIGRHLVIRGLVAWLKGDCAASRVYFEETLTISRELGDEWSVAIKLANLGFVARRVGDLKAARACHQEGVLACRRMADRRGVAWHLVGMAGVKADQDLPERAAILLGAATAALEGTGSMLPPPQQAEYDRTSEQAVAALGREAFATAYERGRAMTQDDVIALAIMEKADPDTG